MGIIDTPFPLENLSQETDNRDTQTSSLQKRVEEDILRIFNKHIHVHGKTSNGIVLDKEKHIEYLQMGLNYLPARFVALDASRPWLCFWILNALDLFDCALTNEVKSRAIATLKGMQNSTGGFGGGPGQMSHLAPTYAAVNSLANIATKEAYNVIDCENLYKWMMTLKLKEGNFEVHKGGEADIRACYCVVVVAVLTNMLTAELTAGLAEWIASCQTYEGGFAGSPGSEAHGGYTFCGLAAMEILGKTHMLDIKTLLRFCVSSQQNLEGGFAGRTNKLVDGCYSTWVGACFPILEAIMTRNALANNHPSIVHGSESTIPIENETDMLFDRVALQEYILLCTQSAKGGLRDKPGKNADYYHTNYVASGLSMSQHHIIWDILRANELKENGVNPYQAPYSCILWNEEIGAKGLVVVGEERSTTGSAYKNTSESIGMGTVPPPRDSDEWEDIIHRGNLLAPMNPVFNLVLGKAEACMAHFYGDEIKV